MAWWNDRFPQGSQLMYRPSDNKKCGWKPVISMGQGNERRLRIAKYKGDGTNSVHHATVQIANIRRPANVELNAYADDFTDIHRRS